MSNGPVIKLFENLVLVNEDAYSGSGEIPFYIHSGSRMLVTLQVLEIEPGATVNLYVDNGYSRDVPFDTIENMSATTAGPVKRILSDFNNLFTMRYTVTGGLASIRVAVALYDNAGTTRIENAQLDVDLNHTTDGTGHFDSTRIGDGSDLLAINPDGSINVVEDTSPLDNPIFPYSELPLLATGVDGTVITYTVPLGKVALLYRVECSGDNIAHYKVHLNGDAIASRRTHHGSGLTTDFDFTSPNKRSVVLEEGDVLEVRVSHNRPAAGSFESRLVILEKPAA